MVAQEIEESRRSTLTEEQERRQKELEDQIKNLKDGSGAQATVSSLLTRGYQELAANQMWKAEQFFDRVIEAEPENGEGWWGKLLVELNARHDDQIGEDLSEEAFALIGKSRNYQNAKQYAWGEFKERFDKINDRLASVAQARTNEKKERIQTLEEQSSEDRSAVETGDLSLIKERLAEAKEKETGLQNELKSLKEVSNPPGEAVGIIGGIGLIIGALFAVGFFIYLAIESYFLTAEEAKEMLPVWVTWNNYDGFGDYGNSFIGFILTVAKALAYGVGLFFGITITFGFFPFLVDLERNKKYKNYLSKKKSIETRIGIFKDEIKELSDIIEAEESSFNSREEIRGKEKTELDQSINIYRVFLNEKTESIGIRKDNENGCSRTDNGSL